MSAKKGRGIGRFVIGVTLVGGALSFLVYRATGENLTYYRTVDELLAAGETPDTKIRISGDVVEGTIVRDEETRELAFEIESTTPAEAGAPPTAPRRIPVLYTGTVPDIFRGGIQVVVEGTVTEEGTFEAETLLAKCPSKYQEAGDLGEPAPPEPS